MTLTQTTLTIQTSDYPDHTDPGQKDCSKLWCQGSFGLLRCFWVSTDFGLLHEHCNVQCLVFSVQWTELLLDISWEHRVVDKQAQVLNLFFFFFSKDWAKIVDKVRLWEGWQGKALKCGEGATIKAVVRCGFNSRFSLYVQGVPETSDFIRWSKFNVKWLNLYNQKLIC